MSSYEKSVNTGYPHSAFNPTEVLQPVYLQAGGGYQPGGYQPGGYQQGGYPMPLHWNSEDRLPDEPKRPCLKNFARLAIIAGIASTIIGILALIGLYAPDGLATLGNGIGEGGSIAMVACPAALSLVFLFKKCYDWCKETPYEFEHFESHYEAVDSLT